MASNSQKVFAVILGARPNFIKAASFFREAKKHPEFKFLLIHTGQHYDPNMSQVFFDELGIPHPDVHLGISGGLHSENLGRMFNSLGKMMKSNEVGGAIVFGDVSSTLAGGIGSAMGNTPLIHVESGLRSYDRRMPEEMNRVIVDHLSDLLLTSEPSAAGNLLREGIDASKIKYVGNIMTETLETFFDRIKSSSVLEDLQLRPKEYVVATFHRGENTKDLLNLKKILLLLNEINRDIPIVFPIHPGTKLDIQGYGLADLLEGLYVTEPLGYFEFLKLMMESRGVITDSGGIQEETSHMGIPCATIRDNTERPITVSIGSNKLFKPDIENATDIKAHLNRRDFKSKHIPLWDNKVSERIFKALRERYL